jgi:hypothetical protein
VTKDESTGIQSLDKTWQEIYDAIASGELVVLTDVDPQRGAGLSFILVATIGDGNYGVGASLETIEWETDSPNGYPKYVHA